ncbi:MAG: hypothetical protein WAM66_01985 [Acidobacteriaceae bacterium]
MARTAGKLPGISERISGSGVWWTRWTGAGNCFGGNFTSGYNWRHGIGPRDKRVSMMNLGWSIPEYTIFGTDEFLHFCSLIGVEPQFALNFGGGTPQEAADCISTFRMKA